MSAINGGGPAFPHLVAKGKYSDVDPVNGMTLRDYFAGKVLCGGCVNASANSEGDLPNMAAALAKYSYLIADAMLKAREATT